MQAASRHPCVAHSFLRPPVSSGTGMCASIRTLGRLRALESVCEQSDCRRRMRCCGGYYGAFVLLTVCLWNGGQKGTDKRKPARRIVVIQYRL